MTARRVKSTASPDGPKGSQRPGKTGARTATVLQAGKRWCFRIAALVLAPLAAFGLLEMGLRVANVGYPTAFLLPVTREHQRFFAQNNQFGWRFFGPQMARNPWPFSIPQTKLPGSVRIYVLGESAAYGDPQPRFGLPRMLQAMLSLRYPGARFEVVNAAMTGINSHTILPIARDCARAGGDIWVIYMGNNEVVGPFRAGTVFGPQTPPLPVIRARLALLTTRSGQWLDGLLQHLWKPPLEKSEWGGMQMFLDHPVGADDAHLPAVYHHFSQNLLDIIRTGRRAGVGMVLSTVAVNLKDCAPFGSARRPNLSAAEQTSWEDNYQRGVAALKAGQTQAAAESFLMAARIDDHVAELHFRQGECALALGQATDAQSHFQAARDLDALRFRCDSRLNELTRRTAASSEQDRIHLADAERVFAAYSPAGLPGQELFHDHVHLTWEGNYLLAETIGHQIETLLPDPVRTQIRAGQPWPSAADCARRLAWTDWNRQSVLSDMFRRLSHPPFTRQANHDAQMERLAASLKELEPGTKPARLRAAQEIYTKAVAAAPEDPWLQTGLAALRQAAGDLAGAATAARRSVDLLPGSAEGWSQLGLILVQEEKYAEAATAFRRAFGLDSQDVWCLQNLAQALTKLGRPEEAMREYRRALAIKPRFGLAWLGQGQLLEGFRRRAEAENCYRQALAHPIERPTELMILARFCQSRGWFEAAAANYAEAIKLSPPDPMLHVEAGQSLAALGRHGEAAAQYAEAVRLRPEFAQARFLYGLELGREGSALAAAEQFQEVVRIKPDLLEARMNLGLALMKQGRPAEALAEFEEVLRRSPTNALALQSTQRLRAQRGLEGTR